MKKLTSEERDILKKTDSKKLRAYADLYNKYSYDLVDIVNVLLDNEKEWFLLQNEPDPIQLAKKHYALKSNLLFSQKVMRILKNSETELSTREEDRKK